MDVLARVRRAGVTLPVLVLTARDAVPDRIRGLDLGADDYVIKPVDLHELAARLRALVRRAHGQPQERLRAGRVLDPAARSVTQAGEPVALSAREFDLLHALMLATPAACCRASSSSSSSTAGARRWRAMPSRCTSTTCAASSGRR
jgi:DNA-binding response OmpR family regulator